MCNCSNSQTEHDELQTATGNGGDGKSARPSKGFKIVGFLNSAIIAFLCMLVKFYKVCISPLFPPCCRFTPTCSTYALEAWKIHGLFRGSWLIFWRICRCNPFCKGGYDPVPPRKNKDKKENNSDN